MTNFTVQTDGLQQLAQNISNLSGFITDPAAVSAGGAASTEVASAFEAFREHARVSNAERSFSLSELGNVVSAAAGIYDGSDAEASRVFMQNGEVR